jgi:heterodisulfide reductase subunit A
VVLSQGVVPASGPPRTFDLPRGPDGFVSIPAPNAAPSATERPGVFVTGMAAGPMDIVDSIVSASAAASQATAYIRAHAGAHAGSVAGKEAVHVG